MATTSRPDLAAARWAPSRHSANGGNCVEIACDLPGIIAVRDSKNPAGSVLIVTPRQWRDFTARLRSAPTGPA
jgi:Domain of unknown function (DUF397)